MNIPAIEPLTLAHVVPLVRLCNQTFVEHARFPEHGLQAVRLVREQPEWQWGAFADNRLAGALLCQCRPEKKTVAIRLIGTDPALRGVGIGRRLLDHLETEARRKGMEALSVGTPFAARFYEKCGFRPTRTTLRMIKDLAQKTVLLPDTISVAPFTLDEAPEILACLPEPESQARFLEAFLANLRLHGSYALRIARNGALAGAVLGAADTVCPDFVRVGLVLPLGANLEDLIRTAEYAVSRQGLRYIGFPAEPEQEDIFAKLGYERAARDFFWTMYTLRKQIS